MSGTQKADTQKAGAALMIEALLPVEAEHALPVFEERAREIGFPVTFVADGLDIQLSGGELWIRPEGESLRIRVTAQDVPHLQMLRDYLTEELSAAGILPEWQGRRASGPPDSHAPARVTECIQISPSYCRVTLEGDALARFAEGGLHFRLLFGPEGADWPQTDGNGVTQWPGGASAWHRPVYTTRCLRREAGRVLLDFDIFLHEGGRVTDWCRNLAPGEGIVIAGPAGGKGMAEAGWQGFVGDETAVPVIARLLADLPAEARGQAVLIVPSAADIQPLEHPPGVTLHWALRDQGADPLSALALLQIPPGDRQVFFAAEAGEAQAARKALTGAGLGKAELTAAAYWVKD